MVPPSEFIPHQTLGLSFLFHSSPPSALHTPLMGGGNVSVSFPQTLSCISLPSSTKIAVLEPDIIKKRLGQTTSGLSEALSIYA